MMKKYININIRIIAITLVLTGVLSSCEFGDTNINPATPEEVVMSALLPNAEASFIVGHWWRVCENEWIVNTTV